MYLELKSNGNYCNFIEIGCERFRKFFIFAIHEMMLLFICVNAIKKFTFRHCKIDDIYHVYVDVKLALKYVRDNCIFNFHIG